MTLADDIAHLREMAQFFADCPDPGNHADAVALSRVLDLVESIPVDRLNPWHTVTVELAKAADSFRALPAPAGRYRWHSADDAPTDWEKEN
jgi:hypothetical protein